MKAHDDFNVVVKSSLASEVKFPEFEFSVTLGELFNCCEFQFPNM